MTHAEVVYKVAHSDLRPKFSPHVPQLLVDIACACWVTDPTLRPTAAAVLKSLEELLESGPVMPENWQGRASLDEHQLQGMGPRANSARMQRSRVPLIIAEETSVV